MTSWLSVLVIVALAVGCGKESEKKSDAPRESNDPQAVFNLNGLNGTVYQSPCELTEDKTRSGQETLVFSQSSFEKIWINFDGTTCDVNTKRSSYHKVITNVKKEVLSELPGWDTYSYEYSKLSLVAHQQPIADSFNKYKVYGYDNWGVDQAQDIAGRKYSEEDAAEFTAGTAREATVKVEADTFTFASYKNDKPSAEDTYVFKKISP